MDNYTNLYLPRFLQWWVKPTLRSFNFKSSILTIQLLLVTTRPWNVFTFFNGTAVINFTGLIHIQESVLNRTFKNQLIDFQLVVVELITLQNHY